MVKDGHSMAVKINEWIKDLEESKEVMEIDVREETV